LAERLQPFSLLEGEDAPAAAGGDAARAILVVYAK
jgi:hypothetical protein